MAERAERPAARPETPLEKWRHREIETIGELGRAIREVLEVTRDYELYKIASLLQDWRITPESRGRHAEKLFKILEDRYGLKLSPELKKYVSTTVPIPPEATLVTLR